MAGGGVVASVAAGLSVWQQRGAERLHSTEVKAQAVAIGLGDPNRAALERRHGMPETRRPRAFWLWLVTLGVFLIADLVALIATRA